MDELSSSRMGSLPSSCNASGPLARPGGLTVWRIRLSRVEVRRRCLSTSDYARPFQAKSDGTGIGATRIVGIIA